MKYTKDLLRPEVRHGILVTGGIAPSQALLKHLRNELPQAPLICADAGADLCRTAGVVPDYIIGDMDSIKEETAQWLRELNVKKAVYPAEKDYSDTQIALEFIYEAGAEEIIVIGALGGRMDHELANMMLLLTEGRKGRSLVFWDDGNRLRYVGVGEHKLARTDVYVGMVPISDDGMMLSIEGLYYPLDHYSVPFGESRLISNCFKDHDEATITIEHGDGILVLSKDCR